VRGGFPYQVRTLRTGKVHDSKWGKRRAHDHYYHDRGAGRLLRRARAHPMSPSIPSSCASAPIIEALPVQMALPGDGTTDAVLVDPLAGGSTLRPLYDLMRDTSVVKVFHAARQDLEIFYIDGVTSPSRCSTRRSPRWSAASASRWATRRWCARSRKRQSRQDLALHRLVAPAADRRAEDLCAGRCHASARDLRGICRAELDKTGRPLGGGGTGGPDRPRDLCHPPRRGLAADQDAHQLGRSWRWCANLPASARNMRRAATSRARASSRTTRCSRWPRPSRDSHEDLGRSRLLLREARRGEIADGILAAVKPRGLELPPEECPSPDRPRPAAGQPRAGRPAARAAQGQVRGAGVAQKLIATAADLDAIAAGGRTRCGFATARSRWRQWAAR
jgi:ribonuclease D